MDVKDAANTGSAPGDEQQQAANEANSANANETVANNANESAANESGSAPEELGEKGRQELIRTRKRAQEAERRAAYLQGQIDAGRPAQQQAPAGPETAPQRPDPAKFESFEMYNAAVLDYEQKRDDYILHRAKREAMQELGVADTQRQRQNAMNSYQKKAAEAAKRLPDFEEATQAFMTDPLIVKSQHLADAILESEVGPELAHYLGNNLDEAAKISRLSPVSMAREIGKIEVRLGGTQQPNRISQAPNPVTALGKRGSADNFDYEKSDINDFMKRRNTEAKGRR